MRYYLAYRRNFWDTGGVALEILQDKLLRKYLHYDEAHRKNISVAEFTNCINKDAVILVEKGYLQAFTLAESCGRLIMVFAFQT